MTKGSAARWRNLWSFPASLGSVFGEYQVGFAAVDVPGFEDFGNDGEGKASTYQAPNHAGYLLIVLRLLHTLARDGASHQLVLASLRVRVFDRARPQFGVNALVA